MPAVARALLSVHDKRGVVELARALARHGCELLSTGGTAALLEREGLAVVPVSRFTGAPEILGGRVKTLHPKVAGGILARRDDPDDRREMEAQGIAPIDLVAVTLYPFEETVARPGATLEEAVENIDIGGPTMIRAAAKNHAHVAVLTDPAQYPALVAELDRCGGSLSPATREALAVAAFEAVARYDAVVAGWLGRRLRPEVAFPDTLLVAAPRAQELRYGENPHQRAAFYRTGGDGFAAARQHQGKELSYNNLLDLDAAAALAADLGPGAAVVVKHGNPCGAAVADAAAEAYRQARDCDPVSAFGGVVAVHGAVDVELATELTATFLEAVVAPGVRPEALPVLAGKKGLRVLEMPLRPPGGPLLRPVAGGLLVQDPDLPAGDLGEARVVTRRAPTAEELAGLRFAWVVAKHVKSNAIVYARGSRTVGIGAGQMSRVDSARLAAEKAGGRVAGAVAASDGFFPFRDGLDQVARAGATAVVQPGGSVRDAEVVAAADEHGVAMLLTGTRHFRH